MSDDAPEIGVKITASGADEIGAEFERLRLKADEAFARIQTQAQETARVSQETFERSQATTRVAVQDSTEQTSGLSRVASALGDTAGWVAERVKEIAIAATLAGGALSAVYGATYVALDVWSTKSASESQDLLGVAKAAGVSVEALTRWSYTADIAAGTSNQVSAAFKKVTEALIAYQDKGDSASLGLFKQVGLDAEVASGKIKTAEQVFERLGDQLRKIPDEARRSKAAYDLLGGGAKELLPVFEKNARDLKALQEEAKKLGETKASDLSANTKLLEDKRRLNMALSDVRDMFADAFFPIFATGAGATAKWINDSREKVEEYVYGLADTFKEVSEDIGKLFSQPLSERVKISIGSKQIDLDKNRMIGLVKLGQEAGEALSDAAHEGAEGAEDAAERTADVTEAELDNYIKVGNTKIQYDENRQKKWIEVDGERVEVSKSNTAKILASLSDSVSKALDGAVPEAAKNIKFNNSWLGAFYGPAQELRKLALDTMDALAGKGWGGRSESIRAIGTAFEWVTDKVVWLRDATLGLFGLTYQDLPSFSRALDLVKAAWEDFRSSLAGEKGQPVAFPWLAAFGNAGRGIIDFMKPVGQAVLALGSLLLDLGKAALPFVTDAFRALRDVINNGTIDGGNTYAFINKFIPDLERAFNFAKGVVLVFFLVVRGVFLALATDENFTRLARAVTFVAEWIWYAVQRIYRSWTWLASILIPVLDVIAKMLGLEDWKDLGLVLLVYWLTGKVADIIGLGKAFEAVDSTIKGFLWTTATTLGIAFVALAGLISLILGIPFYAAAGIAALVVAAGGALISYWSDIKSAAASTWDGITGFASKSADYVMDKWRKLKDYFVGVLYPVMGKWLGWQKPETPEEMGARDAEAATKEKRPFETGGGVRNPKDFESGGQVKNDRVPDRSQIVMGTDGQWRSQEEEDRRTGGDAASRTAMATRSKAEADAAEAERRREFERAFIASLVPEGTVGGSRVVDGTTGDFKGFRTALNDMRGTPVSDGMSMADIQDRLGKLLSGDNLGKAGTGAKDLAGRFVEGKPAGFADMLKNLRESMAAAQAGAKAETPFAAAPLATPQAPSPPPGMVPIQPVIAEADDKTLWGTPGAVDNLIQQLEAAGLVVKTPRPREL